MELVEGRLPWSVQGVRIAVIGDLILDEYLNGQVHRISPEAPVPVHLVSDRTLTAGGAANVARNIQLAGGQAILLGVLGEDEAASALKKILTDDGVNVEYIVQVPDRPTIKKTRVSANRQQIVRIDWEKPVPIGTAEQELLLEHLKGIACDVFLLSDYAKGCLTLEFTQAIIALGRALGRKVIVDPKGPDYHRYSGAFLLTPNRAEAMEALNIDRGQIVSGRDLALGLMQRYDFDNVVVTLGGDGMVGLSGLEDRTIELKARTREVFDVSGAGDTVVALIALSTAAGLTLDEAMAFANTGAGIVVEKWGTQPVFAEELRTAVLTSQSAEGFSSTRKITGFKQLKSLLGPKESRKKAVVFTNGCFDILHAGHVSYLEAARNLGDMLVVAVNSDYSVKRLKGESRPIIDEENRLRMIAALGCVDYVLKFDEDTPEALIRELNPDVLVKGADYEIGDIVGASGVLSRGGSVERIAFVEGLSTTDIIRRVKALN